ELRAAERRRRTRTGARMQQHPAREDRRSRERYGAAPRRHIQQRRSRLRKESAMKAKHIPGPWEVMKPGEGGNEGPNLEIHDPYGRTATVYGELDAENYATANLIAAAPDLIAVLERIV